MVRVPKGILSALCPCHTDNRKRYEQHGQGLVKKATTPLSVPGLCIAGAPCWLCPLRTLGSHHPLDVAKPGFLLEPCLLQVPFLLPSPRRNVSRPRMSPELALLPPPTGRELPSRTRPLQRHLAHLPMPFSLHRAQVCLEFRRSLCDPRVALAVPRCAHELYIILGLFSFFAWPWLLPPQPCLSFLMLTSWFYFLLFCYFFSFVFVRFFVCFA